MADISSLSLNPAAPIDWDGYKDSGEYRRPPAEGKYFFQVPTNIKAIPGSTGERDTIVLTADKEGALLAIIDGSVITNATVDGANGYRGERRWIDTKRNKYREGTSMGDYLRAHGINPGPLMAGKSGAEQNVVYANLLEQTLGRIYQATTRWEGRCSDCDEKKSQFIGMASFPKDKETGLSQHIVQCKHCGKDIFARLRIQNFISTVKVGTGVPASSKLPVYA